MISPARLSIVTVNYSNYALTAWCMSRTFEALPHSLRSDVEFVIVDNASPGSDYDELIRAAWPAGMRVNVVKSPVNGGFGAGCNLGAARAAAPQLFFLNSDAWLTSAAGLQQAFDVLNSPNSSFVFPAIQEEDGTPHPNGTRAPTFVDMLHKSFKTGAFLRKILGADRLRRVGSLIGHDYLRAFSTSRATNPFSVEVGTGAAFLTRRDRFESLGRFDERFFLYDEDLDLFVRSLKAGHRHMVVPSLLVQTRNSSTTCKVPTVKLKQIKRESRSLFIKKHFAGLQRAVLLALNRFTWVLY